MIDKLSTSPYSSEDSELSLDTSPINDDSLKLFDYPSSRRQLIDTGTSTHTKARRLRANDRERRRVHLINRGMDTLRSVVPGLKDKRKLTKLELLRSAYNYIWLLNEALRTGKTIEELTTPPDAATPIVYYVTYQMPSPYNSKRETKPYIVHPNNTIDRPYMDLPRDIPRDVNNNFNTYPRGEVADRPMIDHQIDVYDKYMNNNHLDMDDDKLYMNHYGDIDGFLDHHRDYYQKPFMENHRNIVCGGHQR